MWIFSDRSFLKLSEIIWMKAICSPTIKIISWNKCNSSFHSGFQCCTASGLQCGCAHRKVRFFTHSPLYFPSPIAVWRLSAASPCENFAQHCDGAGGRRLDGTGRVSGEEWPLSRWVQRLTLRSHDPILFKGQLLYWLSLSLFACDERIWLYIIVFYYPHMEDDDDLD